MKLKLKSILYNVLFVAVVLIIFSHLLFTGTGNQSPTSVVMGDSMEPTLHRGDIVTWVPVKLEEIRIGDIIVYESYLRHDALVIHRVVNVTSINGKIYFETKGDANNYTDQKGPHAPEPFIGEQRIKGKVLSIKQEPLRIPYIGNLWLWGEESQGKIIAVAIICFTVTGLLVFAALIAWREKKDEKNRLTALLFGPERLRYRRVFAYAITIFIILLLLTALFAYDRRSTSLGVETFGNVPESSVNFGTLGDGGREIREYDAINPTLLPLRFVAFAEGNITAYIYVNESVYTLQSGDTKSRNVAAYVPYGSSAGTYEGYVYVYSSPFWMLLPTGFMEDMMKWNPRGAIIVFDLLSAFILSIISVMALFVVSTLIDEYIMWRAYASWKPGLWLHVHLHSVYNFIQTFAAQKHRLRRAFKKCFGWLLDLDWIEVRKGAFISVPTAFFFVPILLFGKPLEAILIASFASGLVCYIIGYRWRAEIILSGIVAGAILFSILILVSLGSFPLNMGLVISAAFIIRILAYFLIVFAILFLPLCFLAYIGAYLAQNLRERLSPACKLEITDI
ncbi:MAG: signal peptidase I [Methanomassiliicoccales archaeon]|nr:MAG: signal peptidase I [Methanomassiliicoccales archaeon]